MTPQQFRQHRLSIISKVTGKPLTQRELRALLGLKSATETQKKNAARTIRAIESGAKNASGVLIQCFELFIELYQKKPV